VPPLLRKEVADLKVSNEGHILIYIVNPGYSKEVDKFHEENPSIKLLCFWDKKGKPSEWKVDKTLSFYQLNDQEFLKKMASSRGYVTTAGFESVCEAMYLGKPVMMVPVEGQFEQACNVIDAGKAGAGVAYHKFNINILMDYLPKYNDVSRQFRNWSDKSEEVFLKHLTQN